MSSRRYFDRREMLSVKSACLIIILLCAPLFIEAQRKSSLAARIEKAIKKRGIGWRRSNAPAILIFPEKSKTLADSGWDRVRKDGSHESVTLSVYEIESPSIATAWLGAVKERQISVGMWKVSISVMKHI